MGEREGERRAHENGGRESTNRGADNDRRRGGGGVLASKGNGERGDGAGAVREADRSLQHQEAGRGSRGDGGAIREWGHGQASQGSRRSKHRVGKLLALHAAPFPASPGDQTLLLDGLRGPRAGLGSSSLDLCV
ncbi:hypothetical protein GOP47_0009011 [Adiantum capillus-veneris]|uniref:Uncharacterized protein n=1 Tax=Adiantum capillus-veneris TaxID=13818 RepID=A0A9D4ZKW7_ADICA|nr:hypothetical protein GOP47_0009011 [Adiantum capillus-veneris]